MEREAEVFVRYRHDNEDVADWMELVVTYAIANDHMHRSPNCRATTMEYAKIPAPENAPFIGGKPVTN